LTYATEKSQRLFGGRFATGLCLAQFRPPRRCPRWRYRGRCAKRGKLSHSQGAVQSETSRGRGVGSSISSMLLSGVVSARRDHNRDLRPAIHL